jgi:choline dehydrogenase-like flavoprotein
MRAGVLAPTQGSIDRSCDVLVVGSGATGGWAAKQLTESGLKVALLEAGQSPSPNPGAADAEGKACERQPIQSTCHAYTAETSHLFVDDLDNPYSCPDDAPFNWIRGRQIGGRLHTWAGMSVRMSDYQFKAASHDGVGEDWPISHADLAPYYGLVERYQKVTGRRARLPQLPDGAFLEPQPQSAAEQRFKSAVERRWPTRAVTTGRVAQVSADATLRAARRTGRLTVIPNSVASRVLTDATGSRARAVAYVDRLTGREREVDASVIFLCASTIESTRLLLNSASSNHPAGLGNSSGVLGHFLMDHTFGVGVEGVVPRTCGGGPDLFADCITPAFRNITEPEGAFVRGYGIQTHFRRPERKRLHRLRRLARPTGGRFWMQTFGEVLPRFENHISVDPDTVDASAIPVVRIECRYGSNELEMAADQLRCTTEMAEAAGFEIEERYPTLAPPGSSAHELGTARMGSDRSSSVLNRHNQCWDVPNLFVTDGSCFTSSGSQNPTLTMMAITVRACDFAVEQLKSASDFVA